MKYSLFRIIHNLVRNGLLYLFILISFTLGAGLFIICMNFRMTGEQLLKEAKRQSAEEPVWVKVWRNERDIEKYLNELNEYPIPYEVYLNLSSDSQYAEELDFLFTYFFYEHIFIAESEDVSTINVFFMNEDLFSYLYGFSRESSIVYLGSTAYEELLRVGNAVKSGTAENVIFIETTMYIDGDSLIAEEKSYPYEIAMPMEANTIMTDFSDNRGYNMEKAVIFPIEDVFIPKAPRFPIELSNILFLHYRGSELHDDLVARVLRELNHIDSKHRYTVENRYLELKGQMEDYSYDMDRWLLVAVSILFLSGVGCIGSMYLLLDKRRHFMAVSIAYGSTFWRIMLETVTELLLVLFTGGILGVLILPLLQKITVYQDKLRINVGGISMVAIMAIAFSVVSVSLGMHAVRIKDVAAVLKEE